MGPRPTNEKQSTEDLFTDKLFELVGWFRVEIWKWNLNFGNSKVEARQDIDMELRFGACFGRSVLGRKCTPEREKFQRFLEETKKKIYLHYN